MTAFIKPARYNSEEQVELLVDLLERDRELCNLLLNRGVQASAMIRAAGRLRRFKRVEKALHTAHRRIRER